jgi:cytochrome c peroxidase
MNKLSNLRSFVWLGFLGCILGFIACDRGTAEGDLAQIAYNPVAYNLVIPFGFPSMVIPADNPLTVEGVELGRRLFYDPILSADSTMSCSSCHLPSGNFTDNQAVSVGIDGIAGKRSSMSLENVGFFNNGLFWDGRTNTLEKQALQPVEDEIELHNTWPKVISKLQKHDDYSARFRKAFGISDKSEITKELAAMAIAQFERTIISPGKSRFDLAQQAGSGVFFTEQEQDGYSLFNQLSIRDAQCGHCHNGLIATTDEYTNNGIENVPDLYSFPDKGLGGVTNNLTDNGKFRAPSLRNIALTAPYMHDGRFETLEQVMDHYATGGHYADNVSQFLIELKINPLTELEKQAVLAFLHTMTDTTFAQQPHLQNPF